MNNPSLASALGVLVCTIILNACGVAQVSTKKEAENLQAYTAVFVRNVNVYSKEANAQTNQPLQEKIKNWDAFAREELERYVIKSPYSLAQDQNEALGQLLIADLDVNVVYGNRALRWAVGFGAGKGGVDSVLTVMDALSGEKVFEAHAESDLSMGGAGGDIDNVLRSNIQKLIEQYRLAADQAHID